MCVLFFLPPSVLTTCNPFTPYHKGQKCKNIKNNRKDKKATPTTAPFNAIPNVRHEDSNLGHIEHLCGGARGSFGPGVKKCMRGLVIPFEELFFFSYALDGYVLKEMNVLTFLLFAIGKMDN